MNYQEYAVSLRRELHMHPEIGFDLPNTLSVVRRELDAMGIPYTEEFGRSSIVATINPEKSHFTIARTPPKITIPTNIRAAKITSHIFAVLLITLSPFYKRH